MSIPVEVKLERMRREQGWVLQGRLAWDRWDRACRRMKKSMEGNRIIRVGLRPHIQMQRARSRSSGATRSCRTRGLRLEVEGMAIGEIGEIAFENGPARYVSYAIALPLMLLASGW